MNISFANSIGVYLFVKDLPNSCPWLEWGLKKPFLLFILSLDDKRLKRIWMSNKFSMEVRVSILTFSGQCIFQSPSNKNHIIWFKCTSRWPSTHCLIFFQGTLTLLISEIIMEFTRIEYLLDGTSLTTFKETFCNFFEPLSF